LLPTGQRASISGEHQEKIPAHTKGSGNIFADLGLRNAEERQLKAVQVIQRKRLMAERRLQTGATKKGTT
jgi:hypothetical protein